MDSKAIIAIAVVAILVVAGACVFFLANNNSDDKDKDKVEVYREIQEGDKIGMGVSAMIDFAGEPKEGNLGEFMDRLYPSLEGFEAGEKAKVTINSKDYDCTIYTSNDLGIKTVMYVLDSEFVAKSLAYFGDEPTTQSAVTNTNLDPTKGADQEVVAGSYYVMTTTTEIEAGGDDMKMTGTIRYEMVSIDADTGIGEIKTSVNMTGSGNVNLEVESIADGKVKFKDAEGIATVNEAMGSYAYDRFIVFLEDDMDAEIAYGEKSSKTMDTEYGKREVTSQEVRYTIEDTTTTVTCLFGAKNVLYGAVSEQETEILDVAVIMIVSYTLKDCTAVTTEEI